VRNAKSDVRDYWQLRPCGTTLSAAPRGSQSFFSEVERKRYKAEPFIAEFADFSAWRGTKVLEVGTGIGSDFMRFVRAGADATGVDLTPAAITLLRERLGLENLQARTIVADAERLPLPDQSFDLVYSWGVLHHTPDTRGAIREIHRVLRPAGEARVMLYSRRSWVSLGLWLRYALLHGQPWRSFEDVLSKHLESPGTKAFTAAELRELFSDFNEVRTSTFTTPYDRRVGGPLTRFVRAGFFAGIVARKR
jgi:ubiquinone/menaquinone biosynthesis C-methylase UbiE